MVSDGQEIVSLESQPVSAAEALLRGLKPTTNVFEVTVERLGSAIKLGLYEPGDQIPTEREIAEIMGVSRATVREAIRLLTEQGVLVVKRGRTGGTFVSKDLTSPNVLNVRRRMTDTGFTLFEVLDHRLVIETGIVELAAQRAKAADIDEMQNFIDEMENVKHDYVTYRKLDTRFHMAIARATQTDRLPIVMGDIHAELSDLLGSVPPSKAVLSNSTVQHRDMVEAIKCQDAELARAVMREHVLATKSYLIGLL